MGTLHYIYEVIMLHSLICGHRPSFEPSINQSVQGRTNIYEQSDAFILQTEVPGLSQNDIEVSATENTIEIKANKEIDVPNDFTDKQTSTRKISFHKRYQFESILDDTAITAKVINGLLEIRLPKEKAKKIAVSVQ